jgi:hypothetical protein
VFGVRGARLTHTNEFDGDVMEPVDRDLGDLFISCGSSGLRSYFENISMVQFHGQMSKSMDQFCGTSSYFVYPTLKFHEYLQLTRDKAAVQSLTSSQSQAVASLISPELVIESAE